MFWRLTRLKEKSVKASRILVLHLTVSLALLAAWPLHTFAAQGIETGTFRLHKFEQVMGEEKYTIERTPTEITVTSAFEFTDRGTRVPLNAKLRTDSNLLPTSFSVIGDVARGATIDAAVDVSGDRIH